MSQHGWGARVVAGAALVAVGVGAGAQEPAPGERERRGAVSLTLGAGSPLSEAAGTSCDEGFSATAAFGARWRVSRMAIVELTNALAGGVALSDCALVVGPGGIGERYLRDPDRGTFATALRGGVEAANGPLRVRLLAGAGRMWSQRTPYVTGAVVASLGSSRARLAAELETWVYRLPVDRTRIDLREDRIVVTPLGRGRVRESPVFVRVGLEVPVGARP